MMVMVDWNGRLMGHSNVCLAVRDVPSSSDTVRGGFHKNLAGWLMLQGKPQRNLLWGMRNLIYCDCRQTSVLRDNLWGFLIDEKMVQFDIKCKIKANLQMRSLVWL
jgi:hypothetical protein